METAAGWGSDASAADSTRGFAGSQGWKGIKDDFLDDASAGPAAKAALPPMARRLFNHDEGDCNETNVTIQDLAAPPTEVSWSDAIITECPTTPGATEAYNCGCDYDTQGNTEWIDGAYKCFKCPFGTQQTWYHGQRKCYEACGGDMQFREGKCYQCHGSLYPLPGSPPAAMNEVSDRTPAVPRGGLVVEATAWRTPTTTPCLYGADGMIECPGYMWYQPDGTCTCFPSCDYNETQRGGQCVTPCYAAGAELVNSAASPSVPTSETHATATVATPLGAAAESVATITECPMTSGATEWRIIEIFCHQKSQTMNLGVHE